MCTGNAVYSISDSSYSYVCRIDIMVVMTLVCIFCSLLAEPKRAFDSLSMKMKFDDGD